MAKYIISDTEKSSCINKRVREDGTLVKKVDNTKLVLNTKGDTRVTNSSKSTKQFFRIDPNHGSKSCDKSSKVLPVLKKTQIHLQFNVPNVKDLLKHHED